MGRGPRGKAKRHRPPTGRPSDFRRPAPCLDSKRNGIGDPAWQRRTIMAKRESTQHKLDRVRAPRVQLTYDVEIGDAIEKKELPFVAGVLGDFTGQPEETLAKLKERTFVNVDKDNFDDVLKGMKPRLQMQADKRPKDDGSKIGVELKFKSLDDFSPDRVVNPIAPLPKLHSAHTRQAHRRHKIAGKHQ